MEALDTVDEVIYNIESAVSRVLFKIFGSRNTRLLNDMQPVIDRMNRREKGSFVSRMFKDGKRGGLEEEVRAVPDLRERTDQLRRQVYRAFVERDLYDTLDEYNADRKKVQGIRQEVLDGILPEAYALVREAARRVFGRAREDPEYCREIFEDGKPRFGPHFDVQLTGGMVLHQGNVAEMKTGEGKTLVATLPAYLNALELNDEWIEKAKERFGEDPDNWVFEPISGTPVNRGVHVVTVNDFLARRDRNWMAPVYEMLGLSVGVLQEDMEPAQRKAQYDCDITYGTNHEFGFDYLRDNLKSSADGQVQRGLHYAVVDEVDNILIDEARTPLVISDKSGFSRVAARHAKDLVQDFTGREKAEDEEDYEDDGTVDYVYDPKAKFPVWTDRGAEKIEGIRTEYGNNYEDLVIEAIRARDFFEKDTHYMIDENGEIVIIDELTGRPGIGKRWSWGLHQAVEAKHEGERLKYEIDGRDGRTAVGDPVRIKEETMASASVTIQNFFKMYDKLSGMTGTAMTQAGEFYEVYDMDVVEIPTNRKLRRRNLPDTLYLTKPEKWADIVAEAVNYHESGQPVLIGTRSVAESELLSYIFGRLGYGHEVLNAKKENLAREDEIAGCAGELGRITIATNMAGRGTDIVLEKPDTEEETKEFQQRLLSHWKEYGLAPEDAEPDDPELEGKIEEHRKTIEAKCPITKDEIKNAFERYWLYVKRPALCSANPAFVNQVDAYLGNYKSLPRSALSVEEMKAALERFWDSAGAGRAGEETLARYAKKKKMQRFSLAGSISELGGLHVIGTEKHEDRRIDNQLRGRAGRQGDNGSSRFIVSVEDDVLYKSLSSKMPFLRKCGMGDGLYYNSRFLTGCVAKAQAGEESRNFNARKRLFEYDQVLDLQRKHVYQIRQHILEESNLKDVILEEFLYKSVADKIDDVLGTDKNSRLTPEAREEIISWMQGTFNRYLDDGQIAGLSGRQELKEFLRSSVREVYADRKERFGLSMDLSTANNILESLDENWRWHLWEMRNMQRYIGSRGYAGDPRLAYKKEGKEFFDEMMRRVREEVLGEMSDSYFLAYDSATGL